MSTQILSLMVCVKEDPNGEVVLFPPFPFPSFHKIGIIWPKVGLEIQRVEVQSILITSTNSSAFLKSSSETRWGKNINLTTHNSKNTVLWPQEFTLMMESKINVHPSLLYLSFSMDFFNRGSMAAAWMAGNCSRILHQQEQAVPPGLHIQDDYMFWKA